jgi:hypothetical protein
VMKMNVIAARRGFIAESTTVEAALSAAKFK